MSGEFFELLDDRDADGWSLGNFLDAHGQRVLHWDCSYGKRVEWSGPLVAKVILGGPSLDLSSNPWGSWVASEKTRQVLERWAPGAVQYFPITIPGDSRPYFVANYLETVACLDETLSHVERFEPGNRIRPDRVGEVSVLIDLHVHPDKARGKHLFRLAESSGRVLVSQTLKEDLEKSGVTGIKFRDATSPEIDEVRKWHAERLRRMKDE